MKITSRSKIMLGRNVLSSDKGFILVTALIACIILVALGILIMYSSTEDLRTSGYTLGEKEALAATESGYYIITQTFNPTLTNYNIALNTWTNVDAVNAPGSQYRITNVAASSYAAIPLPGTSMETSQSWAMARYDATVSGQNTNYNVEEQVDIGIAYGPVSLTAYQ